MNRVIHNALKKIKKLDTAADRRRFLRALRYAVRGDGGMPPKVLAPQEIYKQTQIPIESQFENWILLDRLRAIDFLSSLGRSIPPEGFRKKLSARNYKSVCGRSQPARVGNSFVFTYLEILQIANETRILEIPDDI